MWYFVSPEIVFGEDALEALDELPGKRALLVTDAQLVDLGIPARVTPHLEKAGLDYRVFDAVEPDPSLQTVRQGAQMAQDYAPDWIIGLGGGSVMDAAKAIWILYERPDLDPAEINPFITLGLRKKARLATIPTTSGTGAEVTWAIVLTDGAAERKLGLGNRENVADLAVVDPALVAAMPARLTADTGMDALTHAIEGYTCTWHNDLTDGLCLHAMRLIIEYLPRAVLNGGELKAREKLHNAATLAGLGFGNALASLAHAMGHALGAVFHLAHGRTVGICLPYTIAFMAKEAPERFADLAQAMGCRLQGREAALWLAGRIRQLMDEINYPTSLADCSLARDAYETQLERLLERALNDGTIIAAPRSPSFDELRQLFLDVYAGECTAF
jgi:alcohol dehydrogenase class IV